MARKVGEKICRPAGYTAAIYAARAMLEPVMISGVQTGGQLTDTTDVENYPGFADVIQGPWLMEQMRLQAEHFGTRIVTDTITSVDFNLRPFRLHGDSGVTYTADAVILATGATAKWLELPSERLYRGFGVSACATCDGFFFRGREVVVVGGGNTAVEDALFLTRFASRVTLVHRRDEFRAEKILQARLFANHKVNVVWDSVVEEVIGEAGPPPVVRAVKLRNVKTGAVSELKTDGVFVAIGHAPATALVGGQLRMKPNGYIWTAPDSTATSVPGIFAAGDVTDDTFRQAVTAAGQGCMAALETEKFLAHQHVNAEAAE
ncbi:MAG TPA: thioredoxin-disulfide reductase [Bauldia sp.]|nr:thioredoxin-disulfide reductase [Bauldia sp.]